FLNRLDCGLLLDLHNVHTNAINHAFSPIEFLAALDLTKVLEIHIAGGNDIAGVYTDSHAGPWAARVWDLLEYAVAPTPNLRGSTFEFHESYYPLLQEEGIAAELAHARQIWDRRPVLCHS